MGTPFPWKHSPFLTPVMSFLLCSVLKFTQECPPAEELEGYRPLPAPFPPPTQHSHTREHIVHSVALGMLLLSVGKN